MRIQGIAALSAAFPPRFSAVGDFVFGTASASYQYEGAAHADGRGATIWDEFCSSSTPKGSTHCFASENAEVAVDQYNLTRLSGDIERMKQLATTAFRLSIAWSRIMPLGTFPVEPKGIVHYKAVFSMLRQAGIEPYVTLFHFDLPLALEKLWGGWLNRSIVERFADYAGVCFQEFGPLVRQWMTINEGHTIVTAGYLYGVAAPGRCSDRALCITGNGTTEPYVVAHHLLLAHSRAVQIYREVYQGTRAGSITMVVSGDWTEPFNAGSAADAAAAQRRQEFQIGWFADPLAFGDYPASMRELVGDRLPQFTREERDMLRGSMDYFALNHYTSRFARALPNCSHAGQLRPSAGWDEDQCSLNTPFGPDGAPIGPPGGSDWLYVVPWGLQRLLLWISRRYDGLPIVITENGCDDPPTSNASGTYDLNDTWRIDYHASYLHAMCQAMAEGVEVRGYFVWSLLDNFEWGDGFQKRFGLYHVEDEGLRATLARTPKASTLWLAGFIRSWPGDKHLIAVSI